MIKGFGGGWKGSGGVCVPTREESLLCVEEGEDEYADSGLEGSGYDGVSNSSRSGRVKNGD